MDEHVYTWAIRRRPSNIVDRWDGHAYRRAIVVDGEPVELEAVQMGTTERPTLRVTARGDKLPPATRTASIAMLQRVLGLQIDLRPFYRMAKHAAHLRELADRLSHRWDPYAGLLYFHLLLQSLDEAGRLASQQSPGEPSSPPGLRVRR